MVIEFKPVFGTPYDVNEKLAFVLMPFNDVGLNNIYENIVKPTVQSKGLECLRANDYQTNEAIMDEIWRGICQARVVIAEMTGLNPNAIYELGISHTIGRPAIMMLQPKKAENGRFPFDISHSPRWMSETVQLQRQDSLENHRNILVNEFVEALDLASKQLIPVSLFSIGSYSSSFKRCRNHLASSSTTSGRI